MFTPTDSSQSLPSLPMTGTMSQRRRLDAPQPDGQGQQPGQQPGQQGMDPMDPMGMGNDYVPPGRPSTLRVEAETPTFAVQLARRHLGTPFGPRRL